MSIEKILILEADELSRQNLETQLRQRHYQPVAAGTLADARAALSRDRFDAVITGVRLPDGSAGDLLAELPAAPARPVVIINSEFGSVESAIGCLKRGAFSYLLKPFSNEQLEVTLQKAADFLQLTQVNQCLNLDAEAAAAAELFGASAVMDKLRITIRKIARTDATVLVQGECGTGKDVVIRALHRQSNRAHAPLIKVNCAALSELPLEIELFGQGSGPGTPARRRGRVELAQGGTLWLDEVGVLSPAVQMRLLRLLQDRVTVRVGEQQARPVDVRLLATTNRRLEEKVRRGEFREDLFHHLSIVPITVPSLRTHPEDIAMLAEYFRQRFARKHGLPALALSPRCLAALQKHDWPGNVRELQNVIERAVILCGEGGVIEPSHLSIDLGAPAAPATPAPGVFTLAGRADAGAVDTVSEVEKKHILAVLELCHGNRTRAAEKLSISIRTLRNKLHEYRGEAAAEAARNGAVAAVA